MKTVRKYIECTDSKQSTAGLHKSASLNQPCDSAWKFYNNFTKIVQI